MKISGGCLCGAIRFDGNADPMFQAKCYCIDCRKTSGAGHAAMMGFADSALRFTGQAKEYQSKADSGNDVMRAFCPTCGSGVYARNAAMPGMTFVRAATLDDPNLFKAQMIVWAARAPVWDAVVADVPTFAESPPHP